MAPKRDHPVSLHKHFQPFMMEHRAWKLVRVFVKAHSEDFVIRAYTVLIKSQSSLDRRTHTHTYTQTDASTIALTR